MKERVFTKDSPCSKVDIWNCFYGEGSTEDDQGRTSDITRTKAIIGRHVPYRLCRAGHAEMTELGGYQYLALTRDGEEWLREGIVRYLNNRPDRIPEVENMPRHMRRKLKTVAK